MNGSESTISTLVRFVCSNNSMIPCTIARVNYLDDLVEGELEFKEDLLWWQKKGLSYTASGYGRRIPTSRKVKYGKKWYRVYCSISSNVGSCFIESRGWNLYIR